MIDLHMHSTCSDGSDSVEELFSKVKKAGIDYFTLTDHDTISGIQKMTELVKKENIHFVSGVEFSCLIDVADADSDCHILGLNYDVNSDEIKRITQKNIENRKNKIYEIAEYLKKNFNMELPEEVVQRLISRDNVGKPQVADEMVALKLCESTQAAFDLYLNDFASHLHVSAKEAIDAIIAAGGIAVWAHPIGDKIGYGNHDTGEKFSRQLACLMDFGIKGLECCYSRYNNKEIEFLIQTARKHNLWISGGSDYHGTRKNVKLGQTGVEDTYQEAINIINAFLSLVGQRTVPCPKYNFEEYHFYDKTEKVSVSEAPEKKAGIFLVLSKFNEKSKIEEYFDANDNRNIYWGCQTNDAPVEYLIDQIFIDGNKLEKIVCLTTDEVIKEDKNGIVAYDRFCEFVKTYVRKVWNQDNLTVNSIPYSDKSSENEEYYSFYSKLDQEVRDLQALYVDYTGGLRDTSFLMVGAIRFLEFRGIKCEKVVYSDFFSKPKKIKNLDKLYSLFQMINGMSEFVSSGTTRQLDDLFDQQNQLISAIRKFSHATNVGDVVNLEKYVNDLNNALKISQDHEDLNSVMIGSMSDMIRKKLFGTTEEATIISNNDIDYFRLIEWCIDNKMYQQAATLFIEKVPIVYWKENIISGLIGLSTEPVNGSSKETHTFYNKLPEWLAFSEEEETFQGLLNKIYLEIADKDSNTYDSSSFITFIQETLSEYQAQSTEIVNIINSLYGSGFNKIAGATEPCYYGIKINQNSIKRFAYSHLKDDKNKKFAHYLLYNNKIEYENINSDDKTRLLAQIKIIYNNSTVNPKTTDDRNLSIVLAYYLAIKILRNMMSHSVSAIKNSEAKVVNELEDFFKKSVGVQGIEISLEEQHIRKLLEEAIKKTKSLGVISKMGQGTDTCPT